MYPFTMTYLYKLVDTSDVSTMGNQYAPLNERTLQKQT